MTLRNAAEKSSVISSGFYRKFLYNYIYIDCCLVTRPADDGHRRNRNMLV